MILEYNGNELDLPDECLVCGKALFEDMYVTHGVGDEVECPECASLYQVS